MLISSSLSHKANRLRRVDYANANPSYIINSIIGDKEELIKIVRCEISQRYIGLIRGLVAFRLTIAIKRNSNQGRIIGA